MHGVQCCCCRQDLPSAPSGSKPSAEKQASSAPVAPTHLQAAQLDDAGLREYLQYLQGGLFAGFAPPPELELAHRLFQRLALPPEEAAGGIGGVGDAAAGAGASTAQQPPAQQQQQQVEQQDGAQRQDRGQPEREQQQPANTGGAAPYTFYGTAQGKALQRQLFHPDYVALLVACSPLVWLLPESLHEVRWGWVVGSCLGCAKTRAGVHIYGN